MRKSSPVFMDGVVGCADGYGVNAELKCYPNPCLLLCFDKTTVTIFLVYLVQIAYLFIHCPHFHYYYFYYFCTLYFS